MPEIKKLFHRLLRVQPSPLRQGKCGPFVFIHINKTAGTSIGQAIGLPLKHHLTAKEVIARIGKDKWETAFKFTLVRNPWDKVVSHYEYRYLRNKTRIASDGISFTEWVIKTYGDDKDHFYYNNPKPFQPQVEWLKDDNGEISIDFIGKFESIRQDVRTISSTLGIELQLPHLNASNRAPYGSYYTDETRQIVARWFREDIELFNYSF